MRIARALIMLLALACIAAAPPPRVDVETQKLSNGLTLLLSRDTRLPVVAVEVRYMVGSAHERAGRSGFAHLFEHLMFQGSRSFDDEYFSAFEKVGGSVNGTTNTDRTNYFERVPSGYLERALWMESDRMEGLLDVLTQAKLDNQRDVVKNERRQNYENRPYGMVRKYIAENLYPVGHPYHHLPIGSHQDLTAASLEDVKGFFRQHYVPSNAIVTIVGDFDKRVARALVDKYFGHLPAGTKTKMPAPPAPQQKKAHVVEKDDVKFARIYLAWHTPAFLAHGDAAMDLVASVLSHGKTSRLYKPLVYDQKLAKEVTAYQASRALGSYFVVQATAAPGADLDELAVALQDALRKALSTPPTQDEMTRVGNAWRKSFYGRVESVMSRAQMLSTYHHLVGNAGYLGQDLKRYTSLSAADVHAQAKRWINLDSAVRVDILPKPTESTSGGAK
jgi:zinc protease